MNGYAFSFCSASLVALPSGGLFWEDQALLCVSDLHLGKSERIARREGRMLPPYDTLETLDCLRADLSETGARRVICLGDSFDDLAAARDLSERARGQLMPLIAGREWVWIEGNHDPGPVDLGGTHRSEISVGSLTFRHIAEPGGVGEVSGHYHPKARVTSRGRRLSRRCFLVDERRLILPAYGTYTGGLFSDDPQLDGLMSPMAQAVLLPGRGQRPLPVPMPR